VHWRVSGRIDAKTDCLMLEEWTRNQMVRVASGRERRYEMQAKYSFEAQK